MNYYELGVKLALDAFGLTKEAQGSFVEQLKRQAYTKAQGYGSANAAMPSPTVRSGSVGSSALAPSAPPVPRRAPAPAMPAPTASKSPSPYGSEIYEKGWSPEGAIARRQAAQRRLLGM